MPRAAKKTTRSTRKSGAKGVAGRKKATKAKRSYTRKAS